MAPETSAALSCPSLEEIAAFIEGKLDDADRERLTAHLATCESCLDLVAETALFLQESPPEEEEAGDGSSQPLEEAPQPHQLSPLTGSAAAAPIPRRTPSGRSSRRLRFLPLAAAAIVLAASLGLYRQLFAPTTFASVYGSLRQTDLAQVAPRRWQPRAFRSPANDDLGSLERSFRAGVRTVDLQAGLEAGHREAALESTRDLLRAIESADLVNPKRKAFYESLRTQLEAPTAPEENLSGQAQEAPQAAAELKPVFHERFLLFGQWTEAGRLAATVSEPEFFEVRRHRRFLDQIQQEKRLDPDVRANLGQIGSIWDSGRLDAENFRRLEKLFDEIIHLSAGR